MLYNVLMRFASGAVNESTCLYFLNIEFAAQNWCFEKLTCFLYTMFKRLDAKFRTHTVFVTSYMTSQLPDFKRGLPLNLDVTFLLNISYGILENL
jgi:hypothetical protein